MPTCELCEREVDSTSTHHLNPRDKKGPTAELCLSCPRQIHVLFTNYELSYEYNTLEKLKESPQIKKYVKWLRKTNPRHIKVRESRSVKRWRRRK